MKIIIINGQGGSGKDTFVNFCKAKYENAVFSISTIDVIKEMAKTVGWNGEKDDKSRKFLSDLKDACTAYRDIPFNNIINTINNILYIYKFYNNPTKDLIIFIHCREPEEIRKIKKALNAKTILIIRPEQEKKFGNHADDKVFDFDYDYIYFNNQGLDEMKVEAIDFIKDIKQQEWVSDSELLRIWDREADYYKKDVLTKLP